MMTKPLKADLAANALAKAPRRAKPAGEVIPPAPVSERVEAATKPAPKPRKEPAVSQPKPEAAPEASQDKDEAINDAETLKRAADYGISAVFKFFDAIGAGPDVTVSEACHTIRTLRNAEKQRDEAYARIEKLTAENDHIMQGRDELAGRLAAALEEIETLKAGVAGAEQRCEELSEMLDCKGKREEVSAGGFEITIASIGEKSHITIKKG